jgi:hypothetical protein
MEGTAVADTSRDDVVNPGNAQHLGATDEKPAEEVPVSEATEVDADANDAESHEVTPSGYVMKSEPEPAEPVESASPCGDCGTDPCCCGRSGVIEFHGPMAVVTTHPPNAMFLSPVPDTATVLPDGASSFSFQLDLSNIIIRELDSGTITDYDLEDLRATADWRMRMGAGELQLRLPVVNRGPGFIDDIITTYHGWLSLPDALRADLPDNQFSYVIVSRQGPVLNGTSGTGLGDLTVGYKLPLWDSRDGRDAAAVRAIAKLPTGDTGHYFSSGAVDASLGVLYQRQFGGRWRLYANADYQLLGDAGLPNIVQQDTITTLWAAEYALSHATTLVGQYHTQRNPLRIGSFEADKDPQELALGFHTRLSDRLVWTGGFNEDIYPETAPDFVVFSHFKWSF